MIQISDFKQINNDINGNPRYVCHFLRILKEQDKGLGMEYEKALKRAKAFGGKKFHNKQYGGGISFTTNNLSYLVEKINTSLLN